MGVAGNVVAAEHSERRDACAAAQVESFRQISPRGGIALGRDKVSAHVGVVGVEFVGDRIQEVSVAGDGQADDAGLGIHQGRAHRCAVIRCVVHGADRADHPRYLAVVAALHDGIQPVLSRQQVFDVAGAQADAGHPPTIGDARPSEVVEVDGLMCAVEVARADVDDTALQRRPVVGGHVNSLRMQS